MSYEVTIGIPVYNVEKYIRDSLDSALCQTFESIEFLVLDDCGTDGSMDIVHDMQRTHPRGSDIRILTQPRNMGIGHGRNRIIEEARGRFLFFMDPDDFLPSTAIEVLYKAAQKYNAQIVYGSNLRIEELGTERKVIKCLCDHIELLNENDFPNYAYEKYGNIPANVWKYLIDIRVYRDNKLFFPIINFWEDFCMTMDLPIYIERAVFISDIIYYYYSRFGTLSNNQKRDVINKQEIVDIAREIGKLKTKSDNYRNKPYYLKRCFKVMMTEFYMVCNVLRNKQSIRPSFSNQELREMVKPPISFGNMIGINKWNIGLLCFWLLGILPSRLSVLLIAAMGKLRGLV